MKEAKIYQKKLGQFKDSLEQTPPTQPTLTSGADNVQSELDVVNRQYLELLAQLQQQVRVVKALHEDAGVYFPVSVKPESKVACIQYYSKHPLEKNSVEGKFLYLEENVMPKQLSLVKVLS